jgi:hypothetical protein
MELLGFNILMLRPEERFAFLDRDGAELMLEQPSGERLWPRTELPSQQDSVVPSGDERRHFHLPS